MIKKIILFTLFIALTACTKQGFNQQNTLVPRVNVNIGPINNIALTSTPGNFDIIQGYGYNGNGIIVFNIDGQTFKAFDLSCPYINPNECNTPMTVENGTGQMSCANCNNDDISFTQYQTGVTIGTGANEKTYYLREYAVFLEGGGLRITNF